MGVGASGYSLPWGNEYETRCRFRLRFRGALLGRPLPPSQGGLKALSEVFVSPVVEQDVIIRSPRDVGAQELLHLRIRTRSRGE